MNPFRTATGFIKYYSVVCILINVYFLVYALRPENIGGIIVWIILFPINFFTFLFGIVFSFARFNKKEMASPFMHYFVITVFPIIAQIVVAAIVQSLGRKGGC